MIGAIASSLGRFVFLILLQVLVLNHVALADHFYPYPYVLILLALPFELPRWADLLIAFITGLTLDIFTRTMGMHTTACVFIGFLRPIFVRFLAPREGYEFGTRPNIQDLGWVWFITYAGSLTLLHHLFLFFVESFTLAQFWFTLGKAIVSSILSLLLMIVFQFLSITPKRVD
jgi:rod shape-determining protein MreD